MDLLQSISQPEKNLCLTTSVLAERFSDILNRMIPDASLDEVRMRNQDELDEMVCHSNDFCDSNEAMYLAFKSFGVDPVDEASGRMSDFMVNLWNGAWSLARYHGFRPVAAILH